MKGNTGRRGGKPNLRGNKRSGRKSAYQEHQDAAREFELMYSAQDIEVIKEKLRKKQKISIREVMLLKEAGGNDRLIATHYSKVVPDKIEHSGPEGKPIPILQILAKKKST